MSGPIVSDADAMTPAAMDKVIRIAQAYWFPIRLWYCIAGFIGFVSLCHYTSLFYRLLHTSPPLPPAASRNVIRYSRLPAAALSIFRAVAFRWTLSIGENYTLSVTEVFLTAAYVALVFTWSLIDSDALVGVKNDPHYWANTAGHVVATQIPLVIGLGMKNNIISLLTGISFNKLNYYHRMTARVLTVLIWVHAAGRIDIGLVGDLSLSHPWIRCGLLAATSLTLLSLVSIRPIRDRTYEIFIMVHFTLAFIFVIAVYFHTKGTGKSFYIWPSFLIWGVDRLLRAIRLVVYNLDYFGLKPSSIELDARVKVLSPYFIRITLKRPRYFHWSPGQCAYLTIPGISPFQAHPFTISSIDVPHVAAETPSADIENHEREKSAGSSPSNDLNELAFFCGVRNGFTKHLRDAAGINQPWKVLLDGPYSMPPILRGYETVVLIAGGSGVTFTLPLLLDIIHRANGGQRTCRRVVFIWTIRDIGLAGWMSEVLFPVIQNIPASLSLDIRLYVTTTSQQVRSWEEESREGDVEAKSNTDGGHTSELAFFRMPTVQVQHGRPDLELLMREEIDRATGDISINVCGPYTLANGFRSILRDTRFLDILKGGPSITLHIETFGL